MAIPGLSANKPLPLIASEIADARCNVLGHMRAAEYVSLFDDAFLKFIALTGLTGPDLRHGTTTPFLLDLHATYLREMKPGHHAAISLQTLDFDERRARVILLMHSLPGQGGPAPLLAATCELAILNMDIVAHRPVAWSATQSAIWTELRDAHAGLEAPVQAGRSIGPLTSSR